jgi:hypothetical protein
MYISTTFLALLPLALWIAGIFTVSAGPALKGAPTTTREKAKSFVWNAVGFVALFIALACVLDFIDTL